MTTFWAVVWCAIFTVTGTGEKVCKSYTGPNAFDDPLVAAETIYPTLTQEQKDTAFLVKHELYDINAVTITTYTYNPQPSTMTVITQLGGIFDVDFSTGKF